MGSSQSTMGCPKSVMTKMREDEMRLSDFSIGLEFWMRGSRWRCTDASRSVVAIKLEHDDDPYWYNGPLYVIIEQTSNDGIVTRHVNEVHPKTAEWFRKRYRKRYESR